MKKLIGAFFGIFVFILKLIALFSLIIIGMDLYNRNKEEQAKQEE